MRTNEVENAIGEITKWEEKIKRKDLKTKHLLVIIFILVKLLQLKLKKIKAI